MINKLSVLLTISFLSLSLVNAEYDYYRTLLDFNDTDGGVVQGSEMGSQYGPHGVVVAPDGHVWININRGEGRMEILDNGDTIMYKPIYVLDPATGEHASFSPIEVLTFPDGSVDTLHAGSATSGSGVGISLSADGHILSSHFSTLYKINYMTGEGVAMWVGPDGGALTEAAADDNGNVFVGYVISAEKPVVVLDENLNYVGNAIDQLGHINRTVVVTPSGEDMLIGSTWNGHGFTHWNSAAPGAIQHSVVDTFGVYEDIDACYEYVGSGNAVPAGAPGDSAYVLCDDGDTTFAETALWVSALDLSPDGETLIVGALTAVWGGPLGGTNWVFEMDELDEGPDDIAGNWHDWEGTGEGVTDGPRGAAFDADGNLYLADYYGNAIYHYAYSEDDDDEIEEPFTYYRTLLDFNDTDGGVVQGSEMGSQYGPHGVVVAPDGHVWININRGEGRMEILDNGDTIMYKPIYVLDPATGEHASFSPIEVLTFPDGSVDTLHAGSATSGSGVGISLSADGHILSSHFSTLYKINYMTGEGVAMWVGPDGGALTEAAADDNGNVFVGYVISAEKPVVVLDENLNYVGNAIDQLGHINRTVVVTPSGEDMLIGSTWNGHGFTHWNSAAPGAIQHSVVDTFGVYEDIDACYEYVGSGNAVPAGAPGDSAYVLCDDGDTTFAETALWVSALDLSPDGETLIVGALTAVWGGPLGGTNWVFEMDELDEGPDDIAGNWHDWEGTGEGVTDGPRGAAFDADGNLYLADYYGNAIYHYAADYSSTYEYESDKGMLADGYNLKQNYPNPFNPSTKIEFSIPVSELVNLTVYDLEGKIVKTIVDRNLRAGQHVINWDGTNDKGVKVSTGMYLYQLRTNTLKISKMMTFIK